MWQVSQKLINTEDLISWKNFLKKNKKNSMLQSTYMKNLQKIFYPIIYYVFVSRKLFWALNDYLFLIQMALNCRALRYIIMVLKKMRLLPDTILFSFAKFAMSYQNGVKYNFEVAWIFLSSYDFTFTLFFLSDWTLKEIALSNFAF